MKTIKIATRNSKLALAQTELVKQKLIEAAPSLQYEIVPIVTTADINTTTPIHNFGGKGIFVKELEEALLTYNADIAIHSVKDMPSVITNNLELAAILEREHAHDVFISENNIPPEHMKKDSVIGTSSLRRTCQLKTLYPHLTFKPIRGNIDTRINKLGNGYNGIILAFAGVKRLRLEHLISKHFSTEEILPAGGQGAIGIECRVNDIHTKKLMRQINCIQTEKCITAERSCLAYLGGHCMAPISTYATILNNKIKLNSIVTNESNSCIIKHESISSDPIVLGKKVATELINQGAIDLIKGIK